MGKVIFYGLMGVGMKENIIMVKSKDMDSLSGQMGGFIEGSGKIVNKMEEESL